MAAGCHHAGCPRTKVVLLLLCFCWQPAASLRRDRARHTHNFIASGVTVHNSIERDSDLVILLHRPDVYERDDPPRAGEADLIIAKHRNGPTTTTTTISVAHQLPYSRFTNLARP